MDRIIAELNEVQKQIDRYKCGPAICDDETTLDLMEVAAERLLAEVTYFKAKRTAKEKISRIKNATKAKAQKQAGERLKG